MIVGARAALLCASILGLFLVGARALGQDVDPDAVQRLVRVERALHDARGLSAQLDEAAALRLLEDAEADALRALTLRSAHRWLAEVYVARGTVALQAGARDLAASSFARVVSLDPDRKLGAAEAHPDAVALLKQAHETLLVRPPLPFLLEITPAHAQAFIDGVLVQHAPASSAIRGGPHVLRVEAAGYAPYAAVIELSNGPRARTSVQLEPLAIAELTPEPPPVHQAPPPLRAPESPRDGQRKQWPWWVAGGVIVLSGAVIAIAAHPGRDPHPTRSLVVEPGELPQ